MKNLINGQWREGKETAPNINPFTGKVIDQSALASPKDVEDAAVAAVNAFEHTRKRPAWKRAEVLARGAEIMKRRKEELVETMTAEFGRPRMFNDIETERGIFTLINAAEEAKRLNGEYIPLDLMPATENRYAYYRYEPIGPVFGISPFNFPINLLMHKICPSLAAGCTLSVKIPPQTPNTPRIVAEIMMEAGCIDGELNVFDCTPQVAEAGVRDDRYKLLTFTGSPKVGWYLKSIAGKKPVILELGNSSAAIVHHDVRDLDWCVNRLVVGSFAAAGQVCISTQRIFIHEKIYGEFEKRFVEAVKKMPWGDPSNPKAIMGPVVDDLGANRIESWIKEATDGGAKVLSGGKRKERLIDPTVLTNVKPTMKVACEEVFGPVVSLWKYTDKDNVFAMSNATPFGLQTAVFTDSIAFMDKAVDECEVAGVMINEYPTFRIDHMPYGGIKDSGLGREGVKYSLHDYTEKKLVVVNKKPTA
ncbi:MAG: aldehyde dehydrogenase family protein [Planctomycetes bacterium]|nr:aldehyde dehydrogenase family protein [Planctomycetota bacterium]NUQ34796.1 aldehyde dehydrogenase family protein [Planctomycetaceae bacterium]